MISLIRTIPGLDLLSLELGLRLGIGLGLFDLCWSRTGILKSGPQGPLSYRVLAQP